MFCITVLLASCLQYAISFVLLLIQDMRQIFLIKFTNILAARKQIISPTSAHIKDYLAIFNLFIFILNNLHEVDFGWSIWLSGDTIFFHSVYLFYAFTVQQFLPLPLLFK